MFGGDYCDDEIIYPTDVISTNIGLQELGNTPLKGGILFQQTRPIRVAAGTNGCAELLVKPLALPWSDKDETLVSDSAFTGTAVSTSATTGLTATSLPTLAPYTSPADWHDRTAYIYHFSLTLKVNSASVTNRSGRMYVGESPDSLSGVTGSTLEGVQTFRTFDLTTLSPEDNAQLLMFPDTKAGVQRSGDAVAWSDNCMLIWIEGAAAGTIFEFEMKITCAYAGLEVPFQIPLAFSTHDLSCARTCLMRALPPGNSLILREKAKAGKKLQRAADTSAVKTTNFLTDFWDGVQYIWNHGGSDLASAAMSGLKGLLL
jgi:hypothetical protein